MAASLGDLIARVGANVSEYMGAMDSVVSKASDTANQVEERFSSFSNVGQKLAVVGAGLTAAVTVPIVGMGAAALEAAGSMEQARIGFTTLLKSSEAATTMLGQLRDFAQKTPFQFPELVVSAQRLMALGFSAQEVIPTLRGVGDAVSALGAGPEVMNRIILALGQMRNSAKLSAQDMKQLTEAGIKGWQYLSEATGISMKDIQEKAKDVLTGAQASQIVLQGMARDFSGGMEAQSRSMLGMWSNVVDATKFALADLGAVLLPTAKKIIDNFVLPVIEGIKTVAHWFGELPAPIQNGAIAIAGLAAAAGPLLLAIGGIGVAIGPVTAGFAAVAGAVGLATGPFIAIVAAIGAATVALVAIGTWVADNWAPIKAVLFQTWDGLVELWTSVWTSISSFVTGIWQAIADNTSFIWSPVVTFLGSVWDNIAPYFKATWEAIGSFLSSLWGGIKSVAENVWNGVIAVIDQFIEWANKIPGVNKLFNLKEAWTNAEKLATQTKKATTEVKTHTEAQKKLGTGLDIATAATKRRETATKKTTTAVKEFTSSDAKHVIKIGELRQAYDNALDEMQLLDAEIRSGKGPLEELTRVTNDMKVAVDSLTPSMKTMQSVMYEVSLSSSSAADSLGEAFRRLSVTTSTELGNTATQAKTDYETIASSGVATKGEIEAAWVAMTKAEIEYRQSLGEDVSNIQQELANYENVHKNHQTNVKSIWQQIGDDISQAYKRAATSLSDAMRDLFTGDFSLSKVGDAFKQLGLDIASAFLDVAANAIMDFIKEHIGALLEALGGLISKIPGIGSAIGGIFGKIGGAIGGGGGGGAGGGGGGGSLPIPGGGGLNGIPGGATGLGLMVGGPIGAAIGAAVDVGMQLVQLFQNARQENTMNAIEENTRYARAYNLLGVSLALEYFPPIQSIRDFLWTVAHDAWVEIIEGIRGVNDWLIGAVRQLEGINDHLSTMELFAIGTFEMIRDEIVSRIQEGTLAMDPALAVATSGPSVSIDLRGATITSEALVDRLAQQITDRIRNVTR